MNKKRETSEKREHRVTFLHNLDVDYWGNNKKHKMAEGYMNFSDVHKKYYPLVLKIKILAIGQGITNLWHFYEPHIEITWFGSDPASDRFVTLLKKLLEKEGITDAKWGEGFGFMDWFCENEAERGFGGRRHALCSDFVRLVEEYRPSIEQGKGVNAQVGRTIHTICNPLGINYWDEAKICFSRGLICVLFRFFSFSRAVWIYTNIFRQKY